MKNSFILYTDQKAVIDKLTDEQAGKLIKAIYAYEMGEKIELDNVLDLVITPFLTVLDKNKEKYAETCVKRAKAGAKGGKQKVANQANASKCKQKQANQADNDTEYDNDTDNDLKKEEVVEEEKPAAATWIPCYENNIGLVLPMVVEEINSYELADEVVEEAIKEAVRCDARKPKYICAILRDFVEHNIKTKADVEARRVEREKNKPKNKDRPPNKATSAYVNPAQREFENLDDGSFYAN